ncbi:nuclear receptor-interacting protein 2 isoform X1 [Cyclopterus lumpus]|uniref:nuclear receptor-interacting protein 2 isoform X1 n=1 Tax=Cyclopterus lumpus TaxID=8103 RepID=UPI00148633E9|nr:nuclear receptor-interacting protein 2 isoform X1 [Cyclopterus lumpus]
MSETKRGELAIRDKAVLHQQRRLKQATQFSHKDSADLLPLDGLKRLGTSKDLQPHSIVQRRLLEGNITRLRGEARDANDRIRSPLADYKDGAAAAAAAVDAEERSESTADDSTEERESLEESEKSLRSDEEEEEEEEDGSEAGARPAAEKTESSALLTALVVQCKTGSRPGQFTTWWEQLSAGSAAAAGPTDGPVFSLCQRGRGGRAVPGSSDSVGTQMPPGPGQSGAEAAGLRRRAALPEPVDRQPVPTRHQREPVMPRPDSGGGGHFLESPAVAATRVRFPASLTHTAGKRMSIRPPSSIEFYIDVFAGHLP